MNLWTTQDQDKIAQDKRKLGLKTKLHLCRSVSRVCKDIRNHCHRGFFYCNLGFDFILY